MSSRGESRVKIILETRAPSLVPIGRATYRRMTRLRARVLRTARRLVFNGLPTDSLERRFERIYRLNAWQGTASACGPGSGLEETAAIRAQLPALVRELGVRHLLDVPCGDYSWMSETNLPIEKYTGADIVSRIVKRNQELYGSPERQFMRLNLLTDELPHADLMLCRDCLDHLSLDQAMQVISTVVRSGCKYFLATTYPRRGSNTDIKTGDWRPLNLQEPPFNLPPPLRMIHEASAKPGYPDKSLALWAIDTLRK